MSETERPTTDWVHLPSGLEARVLWHSLHDAELRSSHTDLLGRTVELCFNVAHLVDDKPELEFVFRFEAVTSARVTILSVWPGACVRPPGVTREEESRLVAEYQSKFREESFGWTEFEALLSTHEVDIYDAELVVGPLNQAVKLQGNLHGDRFPDTSCEIVLRFETFTIRTSELEPMSLEAFEKLGDDYWEDWAARRDAKNRDSDDSS